MGKHDLRNRRGAVMSGLLDETKDSNVKAVLAHIAEHHGFKVDGHWSHDEDGWAYLEWENYVIAENSDYHEDHLQGLKGTLSLRMVNVGTEDRTVRWYLLVSSSLIPIQDVSAVSPKGSS